MTESNVILVVDDNEMNRDMLSRRLKRQGYEVAMAENGQTALDMLHKGDYALVLLDVMMPRMNGYEVLETVKADAAIQHIPVIMISAVDDLDSVVKCIELGADDYLFKPFNPILLKARVQASLRRSQQGVNSQVHALLTDLVPTVAKLQGRYPDDQEVVQLTQKFESLRKLLGE